MRTLRPTVQPNCCSPCANAVTRGDASRSSAAREHTDAPHPFGLLRARRERPRGRCTAECGQQFPPSDGECHTPLPCEVRTGTIPRHERAVFTAGKAQNGLRSRPRCGRFLLIAQIFAAGRGRMSALGANRTRWDAGMTRISHSGHRPDRNPSICPSFLGDTW